jgi:hypothetical protein
MEDTRGRWERAYNEALDFDTWGQVRHGMQSTVNMQAVSHRSKRADLRRLKRQLKATNGYKWQLLQ